MRTQLKLPATFVIACILCIHHSKKTIQAEENNILLSDYLGSQAKPDNEVDFTEKSIVSNIKEYEIKVYVLPGNLVPLRRTPNGIVTLINSEIEKVKEYSIDNNKFYLYVSCFRKQRQATNILTLDLELISDNKLNGSIVHVCDGNMPENILESDYEAIYEMPNSLKYVGSYKYKITRFIFK